MNAWSHSENLCRNEGCARRAEPGELYCPNCGLERSLYDRDARRDMAGQASRDAVREPGR